MGVGKSFWERRRWGADKRFKGDNDETGRKSKQKGEKDEKSTANTRNKKERA